LVRPNLSRYQVLGAARCATSHASEAKRHSPTEIVRVRLGGIVITHQTPSSDRHSKICLQ